MAYRVSAARALAPIMVVAVLGVLAACSTQPPAEPTEGMGSSAWALASVPQGPSEPWIHQTFPGKRASEYRSTRLDGRDAVVVQAESSASIVRKRLRVEATDLARLRFSWKVPQLIPDADLSDRDRADSPVRVVLAFEGDRSRFSARDAMLSELAHALTGEPMPYATLMYVWTNTAPVGGVIINTRTSRIRKLVLESGPANLGRWLDYDRDIRADFMQAFGEEPGALVSIGIMTDTDNTHTSATAWYGPLQLVPRR